MYENKKICSACGGKCCKMSSGFYHPGDFKDKEDMKKRIKDGSIAIYTRPGDPREGKNGYKKIYILRPRGINRKNQLFDNSWQSGTCIHLTESGCELHPSDRPAQCNRLKPNRLNLCQMSDGYKDIDIAIAWIPYQAILRRIKE